MRPVDVERLLRSPVARKDEADFEFPLAWPTEIDLLSPREHRGVVDAEIGFVQRYFAEGKRPIVWFGHSEPERTLWLLLRGLWPALRVRFAACTLCLQPRTLDDRPFDLMFAPTEAYPRFLKVEAVNMIDSSRPMSLSSHDSWCQRWAERLFAVPVVGDVLDADLFADLDDDPTAIRRLYLIDTAMRSDFDAPQAAVGAMDLVESVARAPEVAHSTKIEAARRAVLAAESAKDAVDGLESLRLIENRLRRSAYTSISQIIGPLITQAVANYTTHNPELVARRSQGSEDVPADGESSWYAAGLSEGFRRLATQNPDDLIALRGLPALSASLFSGDKGLAFSYARALFSRQDQADILHTLRDWLGTGIGRELRPELRKALLPLVISDKNDLLRLLLRGISEDEVNASLDALNAALADPGVAKIVEQGIASEYPVATRSWVKRHRIWTSGQRNLLAATYALSREGLEQLVNDEDLRGERGATALAAFLANFNRGRYPAWIRNSRR